MGNSYSKACTHARLCVLLGGPAVALPPEEGRVRCYLLYAPVTCPAVDVSTSLGNFRRGGVGIKRYVPALIVLAGFLRMMGRRIDMRWRRSVAGRVRRVS